MLCSTVFTSLWGRGVLGLCTVTLIVLTLRETLKRRRPKDETTADDKLYNMKYMLAASLTMLLAHLISIIFIFRVEDGFIYLEIIRDAPAIFCIGWSVFFSVLAYGCLVAYLFLRDENVKKESWTTFGTHNNLCLWLFGITTVTLLLYILLFKHLLH